MKQSVEQSVHDRRTARRRALKTPIRIRSWKAPAPERLGESLNISASGIYFTSRAILLEGETVEILFEMPQEFTSGPTSEWRYTGHVVRVEAGTSDSEPPCVAVRFDCYEVARPSQTGRSHYSERPGRDIAFEAR